MAEFDDKLNRILSNPDAMAQIARLAQSLNGPPPDSPPPMGNAPPSGNPPPVGNAPPPDNPPPVGNGPPSASPPPMGNAPPPGGPPPMGNAPPSGNPPPVGNAPPPSAPGPPDGDSIAHFLPLLQELGGDSDARRLLYALRPYLRPQKQDKVERALRLARLFRVGKKFLSQWEG